MRGREEEGKRERGRRMGGREISAPVLNVDNDFSTNRTFPYFPNIPIFHNLGGLGEFGEM